MKYKLILDTINELSNKDFQPSGLYEELNLIVLSSTLKREKSKPVYVETTLIGDKANLLLFLIDYYDEDRSFFEKHAIKLH